jgi:hypothetical protein
MYNFAPQADQLQQGTIIPLKKTIVRAQTRSIDTGLSSTALSILRKARAWMSVQTWLCSYAKFQPIATRTLLLAQEICGSFDAEYFPNGEGRNYQNRGWREF